ncbi:MAG: hypothetical protein P857_922 [Candidatus Xenolissoclinum pacificiensis L6]|uniref:Uncharacterized protein n=1 Tax=Candidatus Xenolissoclinum pacificiensis L6 TaxID=1401685 RepID=W2V0J2_9RICK|nr:MAG: hypothetical protein P857_922 [Candidatus Xenolissoclinum pacificiensis L6]
MNDSTRDIQMNKIVKKNSDGERASRKKPCEFEKDCSI